MNKNQLEEIAEQLDKLDLSDKARQRIEVFVSDVLEKRNFDNRKCTFEISSDKITLVNEEGDRLVSAGLDVFLD